MKPLLGALIDTNPKVCAAAKLALERYSKHPDYQPLIRGAN